MRSDVLAVQVQRAQKGTPEGWRSARLRTTHVVEGPDPADGAQRHVHGARPVHAIRPRVAGDPIVRLAREFLRVTLVAGQPVGLPQGREMLTATELPWNLDVAGPIELAVVEPRRVLDRPLAAALEVGVPR